MDRLTGSDWLSVVLFSIGYLVMGIVAFIKLNIKNTENAKDILALRSEFNEHKEDNKQERREVNNKLDKLLQMVSEIRGELNEKE